MRRGGFTLLEVLLAVFVLAIGMGSLIEMVSQNLRELSRANERTGAMRLAEQRVRELAAETSLGQIPPLGTTDGVFEEPYEDMLWELRVEAWAIPLEEDTPERRATSSIFGSPQPGGNPQQGSLRRLVLRVYRDGEDPDSAEPFVLLAVEPPQGGFQDLQPPGPGPGQGEVVEEER